MHILIITALYPPAVGGAATYFGNVAPRLARQGPIEHLIVLTEHLPGLPREIFEGNLRLLRYLPTRVSGSRRPWLIHAATYVLTQAWFAARLPSIVRQMDIDLIHFHTRYRGHPFYNALARSGVPIIADLRDKMTDPTRLVDVVDRLLCCGEGVQRFAIEGGFPPERTALIPIPFTPPKIPSPTQVSAVRQHYGLGEDPYLLFIGDITFNKGVFDLLDAYQHWRPNHPSVQLVFAGTNRESKDFATRAEQTVGAHYIGRVPHREALALMRGAEILALPSRSEGLPRVILEAIALDTKVIGPPGIPEFERHLPTFVLPNVNTPTLTRTLKRLWGSKERPSYPLHQHDIRLVVEKLLTIYEEAEKA